MVNEPSIVNADEKKLISLINGAQRRVVFVAPGVSEAVAWILAKKWVQLGPQAVQVVLDVDPEVCRLGYGTLEGLKLLRECAARLRTLVCHHPGIRIGLLITDDATLVYSPTPLLVEAGSSHPERPNAIQLSNAPAEVLRDMGLGEGGGKAPIIRLDKGVEPATLDKVEADLKANPPVKFDLARKVRVFTSRFQFVELEMTGIYISRKRVPIPSSLVGLARNRALQSQFHAHFNMVNQTSLEIEVEEKRTLTEKSLHDARQEIIRRFLIPLKGYGMVVLRANKDALIEAVENLKADITPFQKGVEEQLQKCMDTNIAALVDGLLPAVVQNPPDEYTKHHGQNKEEIRPWLERKIRGAFGKVSQLVQEMKVSLVFKDLTYESLNDERFLEIARKAIPGLDRLHVEYDAAPETKNVPVLKDGI